jgi:uncharacterized protein (TIGR00251 family)
MANINVQVQPNAGRSQVVSFVGGVLKVKIAAPPVEGKANKKLVEFLSEMLDISKSQINIVKGASGKNKVIEIDGLDVAEVKRRFSLLFSSER